MYYIAIATFTLILTGLIYKMLGAMPALIIFFVGGMLILHEYIKYE